MKTSLTSPKDALPRARLLRRKLTPAEKSLWERLRDRRFLGLKFRRQVPIGPYVADFYCDAPKLVVEVDGDIHEAVHQSAHDENRDSNLRSLGYTVLRFTNQQVLEATSTVLAEIARFLESNCLLPPLPWGEEGRGGEGSR